jgi:Transcriptional regulator PadR-like family
LRFAPALWILLSLAAQLRHGYGLMKDVETLSDGHVRLSTGTMYGALRRLLEAVRGRTLPDCRVIRPVGVTPQEWAAGLEWIDDGDDGTSTCSAAR